MSTCTEFEAWMQEIAAGQASGSIQEAARRHAGACSACGEMLGLHERLLTLERRDELVPQAALRRARAQVLSTLLARRNVRPAERAPWWSVRMLRPAAVLALAAALLGGGFASGVLFTRARQTDDAALSRLVQKAARRGTELADVENSRYQYSNVSFRDVDDSRLGLSFDVTTHVEIAAERSDPLVRALLIQSLLNPSPVGNRLKAMAFAQELKDPGVKQALIVAMLNDSSVAVRLKAQSVLASYPPDAEIESACLAVLRGDSSVEMRLQAIEYFVANKIRPEALKDVLRDLEAKDDTPVLLRASRYTQ